MQKFKMSDPHLQSLISENDSRINSRIKEVDSRRTPATKILLAMDFDECVIEEHLSKMVTKYYWERGYVDEEALIDLSVKGMSSLFNCYVGLTELEFNEQIDRLVSQVKWRKSFKEFFTTVVSRQDILPVFISSGLTVGASRALASIGFNDIAVIADDLLVEDGIILGAYTIVSDQLKGDIVQRLQVLGDYEKVVTVGHSNGDVQLIENGTKGYRISLRDSEESMSVADHVVDRWEEVEELLS